MTFDNTKLKTLIIVSLALFAALYLGITAATAQTETIAWVFGTTVLFSCLLLGRKIWLIIPFLTTLNFSFLLPGVPTSLLIGQALFLGFTVILLLMRKCPMRIQFTELEFWTLVLVLFVAQVYVRNPTGILLFGGDTVGGRAYFEFAITVVCALFLFGLRVPAKELKLLIPLFVTGAIVNFVAFTVGFFFPSLGVWYGAASAFNSQSDGGHMRATRVGFLGNTAKNISQFVAAYISPIHAVFRPFWGSLIMISILFAGASGFRNNIATVGLTYTLALLYRGGFMHFLVAGFLSVFMIAMISVVNLTHPLPPNFQRSLSFLPGTWEEDIQQDADGSTKWRMEIWKEVLFTDRWISNKLLGDGLGFTTKELQTQLKLADKVGVVGVSGFDMHRETILANGDYHSGPVQTIRTIGYLGLIGLLLAMIRLGVHAHRQIQRCRGTEWFPLALFIGIPLIWAPIFFVFIFGSFQIGATGFLMGAAMVRILENNLPLPAYVSRRSRTWVPLPSRQADQRPVGGRQITARSV